MKFCENEKCGRPRSDRSARLCLRCAKEEARQSRRKLVLNREYIMQDGAGRQPPNLAAVERIRAKKKTQEEEPPQCPPPQPS